MADLFSSITTYEEGNNDILENYKKSITIADGEREKYMKDYGQIALPTEQLGMDAVLKENYLLEYAMKHPNEYVEKRNKALSEIKNEVDNEFVKLYKQFTEGDYALPAGEAKKLAFQGAENYERLAILRLEQLYPSKFEGTAYKRLLLEQQASRTLDFGGEKE
eukprot:gene13250-10961_t